MFDSAKELEDALRGEFGEQEQQAAIQWAEEMGIELVDEDEFDEDFEGDEDDLLLEELTSEVERIEHRIGRELTSKEITELAERVPAGQLAGEEPIDLMSDKEHVEYLQNRGKLDDNEGLAERTAERIKDEWDAEDAEKGHAPQ